MAKKNNYGFSLRQAKEAELADSIINAQQEKYAAMTDEELFTTAEFNEADVEKTGYSNYSYWRCTFQAFFKRKVAMFLVIVMLGIIAFTFIQPLLPNQYDPNKTNQYQKEIPGKWGSSIIQETQCANEPPYLNYKFQMLLSKVGLVDKAEYTEEFLRLRNAETGETYESIEDYFDIHGVYWLGTNSIGQDLWARIWSGTRTSLIIGFSVALIEAFIGILVGVLWGYIRKLDFLLTELYNILDNIPNTLLLILISFILKPSVRTLIFAMCLTGWIQMARFIRNQILVIRDRDYNTASRCLGTPVRKILLKNCLPYLVSVIMLRMALTIPGAIGSEVFISYIGLGLPTSIPSLGELITSGRQHIGTSSSFLLIYPKNHT